jgi:hypothetical protein
MNSAKPEWADSDWRRLLVAYADGELDAQERGRVDRWLESHPEAARELRAQRALSPNNLDFWAAVEPPVPSSQAWAKMWEGVHAQPHQPNSRGRVWPDRWMRRGLLALAMAFTPAAAAAVVIAVTFDRPIAPNPAGQPVGDSAEETFLVATSNDVEIQSVRDADLQCMVVGEAPLKSSLTLANSGDVRLDGVRPDWDGMVPNAHMGDGANVPMIFPQVARNP